MTVDLDEQLDAEINRGTIPGVVLLVEKRGKVVYSTFKGERQRFQVPESMTPDTIFDLASLTKPLATAVLCLHILHSEKYDLDCPIYKFIPEIATGTREVTVRQLLLHTACLPPVPDIYKEFPDAAAIDIHHAEKKLLSIEPLAKPGSQVIYSCTGYLFLGIMLKRITGVRLKDLFAGIIAEPCSIVDLFFCPDHQYRDRIATTEFCLWRKRWIRGEVHDENSFCLGGDGGNAGLFGSAYSVLELLSLFTFEGFIRGVRILQPDAITLMTTCQTPTLNLRKAVGFTMQDKESKVGPLYSKHSFGHTGFTGTSVWIDPEAKLKVILLSNRVHLGRIDTAEKLESFRKAIHSSLFREFG